MIVIFDIDGTLTDFNKFIWENAVGYFKKKYGFNVMNPDELEIEDIFDIHNILVQSGKSDREAIQMKEKMLNHFWISHRFIKFIFLNRFRHGAGKYINYLKKQGIIVEIHSSRKKTHEDSWPGAITRMLTIWQFRLNGVFLGKTKFFFYPDDKEKVAGILTRCPTIVFEDKQSVVEDLTEAGKKVICVSGLHNKMILPSENVEVISEFEKTDIEEKIERLLGKTNYRCHKKEAKSAKFFRLIVKGSSWVQIYFRPIVLHPENILSDQTHGIIYAPNHRSTLDPIVLESILKENIHWAALERFFKGEDSIFNNSKNTFLCNVTKYLFQRLGYFPIVRKSDNQNANNLKSIIDMNLFLQNGYKIGIFAEGTIRRGAGQEFGIFDDSFIRLAKKSDSWVQPITILWRKQGKKVIWSRVIVNFGKPFQLGEMSIKDAMKYFVETQKELLRENERYTEA